MEFLPAPLKAIMVRQNKQLQSEALFLQHIINVDESNKENSLQSIFKFFEGKNFEHVINYFAEVLEYASCINPRNHKQIVFLIENVVKHFNSSFSYFTRFIKLGSMLSEFGLIQKPKDFEPNSICLYEKGTFGRAIVDDDVDLLQQLIVYNGMQNIEYSVNNESWLFMDFDGDVDPFNFSALFCSVKCFKYLLLNGGIANERTCKCAVFGGSNEIVQILNQKELIFDDCLEISVAAHKHDLFLWLNSHFEYDQISLFDCLGYFNEVVYYYYLENGADPNERGTNGMSLFHFAEYSLVFEVYESLYNYGCDINSRDDFGQTSLHCAADEGKFRTVDFFVSKGCEIDAQNSKGMTALHYAISRKHVEITKYLVINGSNVNLKDFNGKTSIHWAALVGSVDIIEFLCDNNCNINEKDNEGNTAINYAKMNNSQNIIDILVKHGANQ